MKNMKSSKQPQNPVNAVIYARYSSSNQTEQSIEGQLHDNYQWAQQHGVNVIAEYIDRAQSGTTDNRRDFQRMIDDAAKQEFEMVIVWKLDRFARNRYDSTIYKAKLKKCGVRVVSVKENITDTPEGIILEGLLESLAEYYSANLSQNVKRGMRETASKGYYTGGLVPYGYRVQDHRLVADEKTAPVIRYVFEEYAKGTPKAEIIRELNRRGIRNRNGKPLTSTSFQRALTQTAYIGEYVYNGEIVPCADPLISKEVFDKVQTRLSQRAKAPGAGKAHAPYLLQGKIFCGLCGGEMFGESGKSRNGVVHHYYCCKNRKRTKTCKKSNVRRDEIETYIVAQTMEYVLTPARMKRIAAAVVAEYNKEFSNSELDNLERSLARINRELDKLVDALIDAPKVAHQKIYARMEELDAQKQELETEASKLRVAMHIRLTEKEVVAWLHTFQDGDPSETDFRRRLIDIFINSVYVYEDRIVVFYNIRGGKTVTFKDVNESLTANLESVPHDPDPDTTQPDEPQDDESQNENDSKPAKCSDLESAGSPLNLKSEPFYVFVHGVFGCIFPWNRA